MNHQESSLKMSPKTIRLVESIIMNNACECIFALHKAVESKKASIEDREALISLILRIKHELVDILKAIGFFDDNAKKSIFDKGGKTK